MTFVVPDHPGVSLVLEKMPEVIVLDSNLLRPAEETGWEDPFVGDLVAATNALIITIPGGKLETMPAAQARETLRAIAALDEEPNDVYGELRRAIMAAQPIADVSKALALVDQLEARG